MSQGDELRSRLPLLAAEMYEQIEVALRRINVQASSAPANDAAAAWAKGMRDALVLLRGCAEAHEQFRRWLEEVARENPDVCGLTEQEREAMFGRDAINGRR
jgi:hypothetical protein